MTSSIRNAARLQFQTQTMPSREPDTIISLSVVNDTLLICETLGDIPLHSPFWAFHTRSPYWSLECNQGRRNRCGLACMGKGRWRYHLSPFFGHARNIQMVTVHENVIHVSPNVLVIAEVLGTDRGYRCSVHRGSVQYLRKRQQELWAENRIDLNAWIDDKQSGAGASIRGGSIYRRRQFLFFLARKPYERTEKQK